MTFNNKKDLKKIVKWKGAKRQEPISGKWEEEDVGIVFSEEGYEGSIWLPQKKEYYHKFSVLDEYGMPKSGLILDSEMKKTLNKSLKDLDIKLKVLTMEGMINNNKE